MVAAERGGNEFKDFSFFKQSNPPVYRHKTTSPKFGLLCEALGIFQR